MVASCRLDTRSLKQGFAADPWVAVDEGLRFTVGQGFWCLQRWIVPRLLMALQGDEMC